MAWNRFRLVELQHMVELGEQLLCQSQQLLVHYMTKSVWTPACQTTRSKIMRINMELVPHLLQQPPFFWECFPLDVGTLLWGIASIQPQEH